MKLYAKIRDVNGGNVTRPIEADSIETAWAAAEEEAEEWEQEGDWGNEGYETCAYYSLSLTESPDSAALADSPDSSDLADFLGETTLADFLADAAIERRMAVFIPPNEAALMPEINFCAGGSVAASARKTPPSSDRM